MRIREEIIFYMKLLKIILAMSLIFTLVLPTISGAEEVEAKPLNMDFPDVAMNWSFKHITKLALLGVINGRENGLFAPNDEVYKQDVLVMAVSLMGVSAEEIEENKSYVLPPEMAVSNYAKGYVITALERDLIDSKEEFVADEDVHWGKQIATREWVARIVIRAIGKGNEAEAKADEVSTFADRDMISNGYQGYINEAVDLKIVSGMPGNVFNPTDKVTRAQMAVFLSLAEAYLTEPSSRVLKGTLLSIDESQIVVVDSAGESIELDFQSNARLFSYLVNDQMVSRAEFQPGMEVYLIHQQDKAYYTEITDEQINEEVLEQEAAELQSIAGTIIELDQINNEIAVRVQDEFKMFLLGEDIYIEDQNGLSIEITDIVAGSKIEATRSISKEKDEIIEIFVKEVPVNKNSSGTINDIDLVGNTIVVMDGESNVLELYPYIDNVEVLYKERELLLEDLNKDDVVNYIVEDSVITSIVLTHPVVPILKTESGLFDTINTQTGTLTIRQEDKPVAFDLAQEVEVVLSGKPDATTHDLQLFDEITIVINSDQRVVKIEINNRQVELLPVATISEYDDDIKSLVVKALFNGQPELKVFKLTDQTKIQGKQMSSYADANEYEIVLADDQLVDLVYSGDKLIEINVSNSYDGEIVAKNSESKKITVRTTRYGNYDFYWDEGTNVIDATDRVDAVSALKVGTNVSVSMNNTGKTLDKIQLKQVVYYRVKSVDTTHKRLVLELPDGTTNTVMLNTSVQLTIPGIQSPTVNHIDVSAAAYASFTGKTVESLYVGDVQYGKVIDINSSDSIIEVLDYNGETSELSIISGIQKDKSNSIIGLDELSVNDRIEYAVGPAGQVWMTVLSAQNKTYWKHSSGTNEIYFKSSSIYESNRYKLPEDVFIHYQWETIGLNSLKDNDAMTMYTLEGTIVELEKK